jgi:hypothetical protein
MITMRALGFINGVGIRQAQTLPDLEPSAALVPHSFWGMIHSYSFSVRVLKAEKQSVQTYAVLTFSGEVNTPREWRGLEVKGYVSCYPVIKEQDMRNKDGEVALGTIEFCPAFEGDEAYLQLEQVATMEFFRETKQLLQSLDGKPHFSVDLTSSLDSFKHHAQQHVRELSIGLPECRTSSDRC